jgi:DNA-binding GntR family transcriptional regulator
VQLTVERRDAAVGDDLRHALVVGSRAAEDGDEATLRALNRDFHETLARGSGSTILASMLSAARNHARRAGGLDWLGPTRSWHDHRAIVESILDGDAAGACARMTAHLEAHRTALPANAPDLAHTV